MGRLFDAYDQWKRHEADLERKLEQRPICADCGEHVQDDHCYLINDEIICPNCLESNYRHDTEDFFE